VYYFIFSRDLIYSALVVSSFLVTLQTQSDHMY